MASLYQLDEETKKLLTLDNFLDNLTVPEFINKVLKNLSTEEEENNGFSYLDPKPYIRTFESTLTELNKLSKDCLSKKSKFETTSNVKEIEHYNNVLKLASKANNLNVKFNKLNDRIGSINNKIRPLGEKLTKANNLKENTVHLIFVTKCYNEFYTKGKPPIELTNFKPFEMEKIALTLNRLLKLSTKLVSGDLPKSSSCNQLIVTHAEQFETNLLETFNKYYNLKDFPKLRDISSILFKFNGGTNIVQFFINKHSLFDEFKDKDASVNDSYWHELGNPDNSPSLDPFTFQILQSIVKLINNEFDSIREIFQDNTNVVLISFLSKFYNELVRSRIQYLIKMSSSYSKLAMIRTLHMLSTHLLKTTESLKEFFVSRDLDISGELDSFCNGLFNEYLINDSYFIIEKESLMELISQQISPFQIKNEKFFSKGLLTAKVKSFKDNQSNELSEFEKSESATTMAPHLDEVLVDESTLHNGGSSTRRFLSYTKKTRKLTSISNFIKNVERSSSLKNKASSSTLTSINSSSHLGAHSRKGSESLKTDSLDDENSHLSLTVTEKILKHVVESLTRAIELVPFKINEYSIQIFEIFLSTFGSGYLSLGLEVVYSTGITQQSSKMSSFFGSNSNDLDLTFLSSIQLISLQIQLLSLISKKFILPLLLNPSMKSKLANAFNSYFLDLEISLNIIIDELIELIYLTMSRILNSQNQDDFNTGPTTTSSLHATFENTPHNNNGYSYNGGSQNGYGSALQHDSSVTPEQTPTSQALMNFTETVIVSISKYFQFDPSLKIDILKMVLSNLLGLLISHFMKFKVSGEVGNMRCTQDIISYISLFDLPAIKEPYVDPASSGHEYNDGGAAGSENLKESEELLGLRDTFQVLREINVLFSCREDSIRDLVNEGKLIGLKRSVIKGVLKRRGDFQERFLANI